MEHETESPKNRDIGFLIIVKNSLTRRLRWNNNTQCKMNSIIISGRKIINNTHLGDKLRSVSKE